MYEFGRFGGVVDEETGGLEALGEGLLVMRGGGPGGEVVVALLGEGLGDYGKGLLLQEAA